VGGIDAFKSCEIREIRKLAALFLEALIPLGRSQGQIGSSSETHPLTNVCHRKRCSTIDEGEIGACELFEIRGIRKLPAHFPESHIPLTQD
jgi:hypothetical protein